MVSIQPPASYEPHLMVINHMSTFTVKEIKMWKMCVRIIVFHIYHANLRLPHSHLSPNYLGWFCTYTLLKPFTKLPWVILYIYPTQTSHQTTMGDSVHIPYSHLSPNHHGWFCTYTLLKPFTKLPWVILYIYPTQTFHQTTMGDSVHIPYSHLSPKYTLSLAIFIYFNAFHIKPAVLVYTRSNHGGGTK